MQAWRKDTSSAKVLECPLIAIPQLLVKDRYIALQTMMVASSEAMATSSPGRRRRLICSHMAMPDTAQKHIRIAIASTKTARTVLIFSDVLSCG